MGADFWWAVRNKQGKRAGPVYANYPENNWRNLDICDWFLAPGPESAVSTARLVSLVEGTQVCEARIFLEDALLNDGMKAKIGEALAKRCQEALDAHHRAMWKTAWSNEKDLKSVGVAGDKRNPQEALWAALVKNGKQMPEFWSGEGAKLRRDEAAKGEEQFANGWQEREKTLFALAGEVAAKLNAR